MGEAKRRGTFLERLEQSKQKTNRINEVQKRIKEETVLPPNFIICETAINKEIDRAAVLLTDTKHNCVLDQMLFPYEMMVKERERCVRVFQTSLKVDYVI